MPFNQTFARQAQFAEPGLQFVVGRFTFNGSGEPDAADGRPFLTNGTNLDRTGAGAYTLTIPGRGGLDILAAFFTVEHATDVLLTQIVARSAANRTMGLLILDGEGATVATDPPDGAQLHVLVICRGDV
jgi:hypothetical protein